MSSRGSRVPGEPATVTDYDWILDRIPNTVPDGFQLGLTNTANYNGLTDGTWYLHVRAMGEGEVWSDTGHRMIRVDTNPPQVTLALDPKWPTGSGLWYTTPVTVSALATDGNGSGVTSIEISQDGVTWEPYVTSLTFTADTAGTTIYARARDAVGHVSEPVLTSFKIDQRAPSYA